MGGQERKSQKRVWVWEGNVSPPVLCQETEIYIDITVPHITN